MEGLTKQQLILLALLVSFVTSIATGIVTVALMNQAPVGVTQTINRVVERTIQTVVPSTNSNQTIVKETVVVNTDDQIVGAVAKNSKSVIRIYRTNIDPGSGLEAMIFVGIGVVVTDDGILATDNSLISSGGKYFTTTDDGKLHDLTVLRATGGEQIALLKIKSDDKNPVSLTKVVLPSRGDIKLGQSVVYIGGQTKNIVATGIVSSLTTKDIKSDTSATSTASSTTQTVITAIETSIPENNFITGGLLLNLSGELVGIKSVYMDSAKTDLFTPYSSIKSALSAYTDSQKKAQ